jgi:hypothetical protein
MLSIEGALPRGWVGGVVSVEERNNLIFITWQLLWLKSHS